MSDKTKMESKTPYYSKSKAQWGFIKGHLGHLPNVLHPDVFRYMSGAPQDGAWVGYPSGEKAMEELAIAIGRANK